MSIIKLLSVIERMLANVSKSRRYLEEMRKRPEYLGRSMMLIITKSDGNAFMRIYADKDGVKANPSPKAQLNSTITVYVPFNIMVDLIDRKYDVDYALAKNWLWMESPTPEGWFYHYAIIRHFMKAMLEAGR